MTIYLYMLQIPNLTRNERIIKNFKNYSNKITPEQERRQSLKKFGPATQDNNSDYTSIGEEVFIELYPYKKISTKKLTSKKSTRWKINMNKISESKPESESGSNTFASFLKNSQPSKKVNSTLYITNIPTVEKYDAYDFIISITKQNPTKLHIFTSKITGEQIGSMVVTFLTRKIAKEALKKIDRETWGSQIIHAQFSKPKK